MNEIITEILNLKAQVQLVEPVNGYWDGGRKQSFEFTPEMERTHGKPAIRWGSWGANVWFVVNVGKSVKNHLAAVRHKLHGKPARTITFTESAESGVAK